MNEQPNLSEAEWALMVELLQREHHELPAEIHHCRVAGYREELLQSRRCSAQLCRKTHHNCQKTPLFCGDHFPPCSVVKNRWTKTAVSFQLLGGRPAKADTILFSRPSLILHLEFPNENTPSGIP
jgi:hypothetical protein